jgi:hypothetical protein
MLIRKRIVTRQSSMDSSGRTLGGSFCRMKQIVNRRIIFQT